MAKVIKSWMNEMIALLANAGVQGKNAIMHFEPVMKKGAKCMAQRPCPKCNNNNAVVFRGFEDKSIYALVCPKCKKISYIVTDGRKISSTKQDDREGKCKGVKKDGSPCNNKAKDNGYCGIHQSQAPCYEGQGRAEKHLQQETRF